MKRVLVFAGTRPEVVKLAPVVAALRRRAGLETRLCVTGQHREMLAQALADFDLAPDRDLEVMRTNQGLALLSARLFEAIDGALETERPDAVLVQGDTTTVEVAALCAFYRGVPVGHVEAGLRSHDLQAPFPEEMNRRIAGLAATWHFAPTAEARENLLLEGVDPGAAHLTGNTVVDALLETVRRNAVAPPGLPPELEAAVGSGRPLLLITGHRRENFGTGFEQICEAIAEIARARPDLLIVYPVHLNPNVQEPVRSRLSGVDNVVLAAPLAYRPFVRLMSAARLILTDSGGVQEEAPSLNKPVLVMRSVTERPEGVAAGAAQLVGAEREAIVKGVFSVLNDPGVYERMASAPNPYGDGQASERIAAILDAALTQ